MTHLLFIKLIRDLRAAWARLVLMGLAMSVALTVFSAVLYVRGIAGREISRAYLSTSPASATILFERPIDADRMAAITSDAKRQPGIIDATPRAQLTLQIQLRSGGWEPNPLQIFVAGPDDPLRVERFFVEQGAWPPATGEILIDRTSFGFFDLQVGDTVVVRAPRGMPVPLRVSGVAYNPALAPSFQEQRGHAFMSATSLVALGEPVAFNALKIQVADRPGLTTASRDRDVIVAAAGMLARRLQSTYGVSVEEIQVPTPYLHPHQRQADLLLAALVLFGVAGLILSSILVATTLHSLFAQQIPQIGIMKAIGARASSMLQLYLLMTLAIAVPATVAALAPGIFISRGFAQSMLSLLGVKAMSLAAPWWMVCVVVACGIGLPLLLSFVSLARTSRITVREALDYRGASLPEAAASPLGARIGKWLGVDRTVLLALRNLFRRRARLIFSVGLLASAGAVFVAGVSTMSGFQAMNDESAALRQWDVDIDFERIEDAKIAPRLRLVEQIPHVTRVEPWTSVQTNIAAPNGMSVTRTYPDQGHGSLVATVIPASSRILSPLPLLEGRWFRPGESGAVVLSQRVRAEVLPGLRAGDTVELRIEGRMTRWAVIGIVKTVFHGAGAFVTEAGFRTATGGFRPNLLRIVTDLHDEETRIRVASAAEQVLTEALIPVRASASVSRHEAASAGHMLPLFAIFLALTIAMGVVGCVGLAAKMSTNVLERTREFGVMRAIGASEKAVRRIVVAEGVFLAMLSNVVAVLPALFLTAVMGVGLGNLFLFGALPLRVSGLAIVIWVVVVVFGAALASLAPASRVSRLTVRESLTCL